MESGFESGDGAGLIGRAIDADLFAEGLAADDEVRAPEKYELVRRLGRGGSGVVWLARDLMLDRLVALKFLGDVPASVLERFRREARFAARLESPSIVKVYELAEHEGRPYIAMEYVDGGNLQDARLDHRALVGAIREVCVALRYAHSRGVVHRDIKPQNILLDRRNRAFLSDFGIARDLDGGAGATLSSMGQIMGTPACMPPEQARGDLHAVDGRSDVYSVGATLFYKLTERWPFEGDNVIDVLHAVLHEPPPLPRSIRPGVPRSLESIVVKCLQKEREDRFPTMVELIEELDRYLAGTPVQAESGWFRKLVTRALPRPEPPEPEPEADPYWTLGMEIARELAAWDTNSYRISRNFPRTFPALDRIIDRLAGFLEERPDAAWARYYRGMALFRRGRREEALEEMEHAIDRVGHLAGAYFELGRIYLSEHLREQELARGHLSRVGVVEHLESTRERLRQAVLALNEARRLDLDLPPWQVRYADAVGRFSEEDYAGCVAECDEILAEDPDAEEVWKLRGDALRFSGGDPFESYARALRVRRGYYEVCLAEARARLERDDPAGAREAIERALRIHPELTDALMLSARLHLFEVRAGAAGEDALDAALTHLDGALARRPEHYEATITRAEVLAERARLTDEPAWLERALTDLRTAASLDGCQNRVQMLTARSQLLHARILASRGEEGREILQEVLAHAERKTDQIDDSPAWQELLSEVRTELAKLEGEN